MRIPEQRAIQVGGAAAILFGAAATTAYGIQRHRQPGLDDEDKMLTYRNGLYVKVAGAIWGADAAVDRYTVAGLSDLSPGRVSSGATFLRQKNLIKNYTAEYPGRSPVKTWLAATLLDELVQAKTVFGAAVEAQAALYYPDQR